MLTYPNRLVTLFVVLRLHTHVSEHSITVTVQQALTTLNRPAWIGPKLQPMLNAPVTVTATAD